MTRRLETGYLDDTPVGDTLLRRFLHSAGGDRRPRWVRVPRRGAGVRAARVPRVAGGRGGCGSGQPRGARVAEPLPGGHAARGASARALEALAQTRLAEAPHLPAAAFTSDYSRAGFEKLGFLPVTRFTLWSR